ncbi:sensor histidine kinase [Massilia niastensis]|uniref:sensor histidine kinase n=1 Tax=Massilia niastensis TaxID=544911 RepID=UPI000362E9A8|nr:sensor histidine kinase [Massilia niastensis]
MKTRTYLFLMAAAILLPVAIAFWIGLSMLLDWERASRINSVKEMARATAFQLDREIASAESALRSIAHSEGLRQGDFPRVHRWASSLNAGSPWSWTILASSEGEGLFNTLVPFGTPLPAKRGAWAAQVSPERGTRVSGYFIGSLSGRPTVSVDVPAAVGAGKHYIVSQIFDVRYFERILNHDALGRDWVVGIFDSTGVTLARNRHAHSMVGKPMRPDFLAATRASNSGVFRHTTHDGAEIYGVFTRSKTSNWTVVIGVPVDEIEAAARTATLYAAMALMLVMGLAIGVAVFLGNKVETALRHAAAAARALTHQAMPPPAPTRVEEVDALLSSLHQSSEALARESAVRQGLQEEREQLLLSEQHARRMAEAQSSAKDNFLAMLGHELRNPLAAIAGAMAVLDMPGLKPEMASNARAISRRQMRHLTRIVDDLLDVQRILSGKIVLQRAPVNLAEVLRTCSDAKALVDAGNHGWQVEIEDAWVDGDRTRLEQIIDNMLHNAIKYTPAGGRIGVRVRPLGGHAVLEVSDSGIGIEPELQPMIFDVLVQGPTSIDRAQGGLGLGLALVKQLSALHGGTVQVHSEGRGHGSTFTVSFPLRAAPAPPQPHEHSGADAIAGNAPANTA